MEKTPKRKMLPFLMMTTIILLASSFTTVVATYSSEDQESKDIVLSDYLLRLSECMSNGNTSELTRIRQQMIAQEKLKQDRIKATNGAVLKFSPQTDANDDGSLLDYEQWEMSSIYAWSPDQYDIYNNLIGHVDDPYELRYGWDNDCTLLETFGWNQNWSEPMCGEALINGYMDGAAWGDIYIRACQGPNSGSDPPWSNYVLVWAGTPSNPYYIGATQVRSTSLTWIYVGSLGSTTNWLGFACVTWYPPPYDLIYNSVYMDCVLVVHPDG